MLNFDTTKVFKFTIKFFSSLDNPKNQVLHKKEKTPKTNTLINFIISLLNKKRGIIEKAIEKNKTIKHFKTISFKK
jgi:hypothetical protein